MDNRFKFKDSFKLLKDTYTTWSDDKPFDMSASVAYYAIFSLPALLLIIIAIAGIAFGQEAVQGKISNQIGGMIGKNSAQDIQGMIASAYKSSNSTLSAVIGIATLLLGSTAVFLQLQTALNTIWDVKTSPKSGIKKLLLDRATALGVILAIGFLLLISLVVTAGLSALSGIIEAHLPDIFLYMFYVVDFVVAFSIISLLFAMMFKILPDVNVPWRSVWIGAFVTAFLFEIGRFSLGLYFGKSDPGSGYGAAGSVILIMLWVYYSCLILFFGAAFTKVYSVHYGVEIHVSENAVKVEKQEEVKQETQVT